MIGILSVFAQLERETILERTRIGLKKRAENGYWRGGGKTPFAYDYDKEAGMLVVNGERKVIFDLMKTLRLQGYSYNELSKVTGYDESWIQGILSSKTNLGKIPFKGELYDGKHEAIISEEFDIEDNSQPILDIIHKMPELYRAVLEMRFVEECSTREIATRLHLTESTVNTRIHRGRILLMKKLEEEGYAV